MKTAKELKAHTEKNYFNRVTQCVEDIKNQIENAGEVHLETAIDVAGLTLHYRIKSQDLSFFFVELGNLGYKMRENENYEKLIISWS